MTTASMSVAEAIRTRRAIRHYRPEPVRPDTLRDLLHLALEAPSSWNFQARSVVAVSDPGARDALVHAAGGQPQISEAPVVLVFVAEVDRWRSHEQEVYDTARGRSAWGEGYISMSTDAAPAFQEDLARRSLAREYAVKDAMIAASFCMLAATEMGLATSPMNGWDEEQVKKAVGIDGRDDLAIALVLPVGHPAEQRLHPGRRPLGEHAFLQRYQGPAQLDGTGTRAGTPHAGAA